MFESLRSVLKVLVGFPALAAFTVLVAYYSRIIYVQPNYNRDFKNIQGLDGEIVITRDSHGFPHIEAKTRGDALFGQGFVHGQDRLWQVEFQRTVGRGELSEIVGPIAVLMDTQSRTMGFAEGARRMCNNAPPAEQHLLQRYVDGLNFYVENNLERPAEFVFMGSPFAVHKPKPFVRIDACLIAVMLMWQMGQNVPFEIDRFNVFWNTNRTYDEVMELFNNNTNTSHTILTPEQMGISEDDAIAARSREVEDHRLERELYDTVMTEMRSRLNPPYAASGELGREAMKAYAADPPLQYPRPVRPRTLIRRYSRSTKNATQLPSLTEDHQMYDLRKTLQSHASNAWIGRRGGLGPDGKPFPPIGASDPHLLITNPSPWYWSHLSWETEKGAVFDAAGVGLAGLPGVHIGKTSHTSWGITMSVTDLADLFIITSDTNRPDTHYIINGTARPFTLRQEVIKVRGAADVVVTVRETVYGPIVTEALELAPELLFAYYTDYIRNDTSSVQGLMCLNDPSTDTALKVRDECLSRIRSPGFSIPSTDLQGNLVYSITGAHPHRRRGHTGRMPIPGDGSFDYWGIIPYKELPAHTITAEESAAKGGYIGCANQKIYPDGYKYSLAYDFIGPHRGKRVHEVLSANPTRLSDVMFHKELQLDSLSNGAEEMIALLDSSHGNDNDPQPFDEVTAFRAVVESSPEGSLWFSRLQQWDKRMTVGSVEGTLYWRWWRELMRTPSDAIWAYDTDTAYWSSRSEFYPYKQLTKPTPIMQRQCREYHQLGHGPLNASGCGEMAGRIFLNLAKEYSAAKKEGNGFVGKRWGVDYNRLTQLHVMLERTPIGRFFQNSIEKAGDPTSVDVSDGRIDGHMPASVCPSMRTLYDWSTPQWVRFSFPAGNSGNIYSPFHKNLLALYRDGEYVNLTVSSAAKSTAVTAAGAKEQEGDSSSLTKQILYPITRKDKKLI